MSSHTPAGFREKHAKIMELLNQQSQLTYEEIAKYQGVTKQYVQQVNVKLGKYGRPSKHAQIEQRKAVEKARVENILNRIVASEGKLWPRHQGLLLVEPETFPTKTQAPAEYSAYANAKQRCTNPKNPKYKNYGGRGILFKFNNFEEFWRHIGAIQYPGLELDRIENEGHYEAGNVRWATHTVNCGVGRRRYKRKVK